MAVHGKRTYVALDNAEGVLTSLVDTSRDSGLSRSTDMADASHFGTQDKKYVAGMTDGTATVSGFFTAAQDEVINAAWEAQNAGTVESLTYVYGPEGDAPGKVRYEQEVLITSYEVTGSIGDLVQASISLQRTGPTTRGVFA